MASHGANRDPPKGLDNRCSPSPLHATKHSGRTTGKHPPDVTLKSLCYFRFDNAPPKKNKGRATKNSFTWRSTHQATFVVNSPPKHPPYQQDARTANQPISLIYLVKEQSDS